MFFNFWTHFYWFILWMATPFLANLVSSIVTRHKAPSQVNIMTGFFTTLFVMVLSFFFWEIWLVWVLLANALLFVLFFFWWKTDESRKWFVWGIYIAFNACLNIVTFFAIWSLM